MSISWSSESLEILSLSSSTSSLMVGTVFQPCYNGRCRFGEARLDFRKDLPQIPDRSSHPPIPGSAKNRFPAVPTPASPRECPRRPALREEVWDPLSGCAQVAILLPRPSSESTRCFRRCPQTSSIPAHQEDPAVQDPLQDRGHPYRSGGRFPLPPECSQFECRGGAVQVL